MTDEMVKVQELTVSGTKVEGGEVWRMTMNYEDFLLNLAAYLHEATPGVTDDDIAQLYKYINDSFRVVFVRALQHGGDAYDG